MSNFIPKTIDEAKETFRKYLHTSGEYEKGSIITDNDSYTTYFCIDKKSGETFQYVQMKIGSNTQEDALKKFMTLCQAASSCNCMFLMPLRAFITDSEMSYVTDYFPYGNLHDLLFIDSDVLLTPTHKTVIAMCVAYGGMKLHDKGFFHRMLNSHNIYLNEEKLPVICEFDMLNSKAKTKENLRYQAPEVIFDKEIDQKVDIYSFGLFLYELSEQVVVFQDYDANQIYSLLQTEQRPQFTSKTPQKLASLIEQCWAQNPQYRPTFKTIYEKFSEGSVSFQGADIKVIKQMAINIGQKSSLFMNYGEADLAAPQVRTTKKARHKSIRFNYTILENPDHPNLVPYILSMFEKIRPADYLALYEVLMTHFATSSALVVHTILQHFVELSLKDNSFMELMIRNKFFCNPPIMSPTSISLIMDLFAIFFTRFTSSVSSEILPQLNLFIAMRPRDSLALLHNYINCKGADESIFNAFLVNYYSFFNADFIAKFATAISRAMETHPFVDNYKQAYNQVFLKAVDQSDYTVVKFGYIALLSHFDPKAPFNYNTLLLHLRDPELSKYALQIASRVQLPKSKSYFEAFFNLAQQGNRLAVLTMCAFMSFSADHVKRTTEFQWVNMLQPDDAFRILMAAAKFNASQNYFPLIPGITDYIYEFYNQIKTRTELHIPFLFLLSCMPFDSNFFNTQKFVDMYNDLFFLSLYSDNDNLKCAGVTLLFQSAKIGYIQNYPKFVAALIEMIKNQCKYTYTVIGALSQLAKYPDVMKTMVDNQLVPYFQSLLQYPQYAKFANDFLLYVIK